MVTRRWSWHERFSSSSSSSNLHRSTAKITHSSTETMAGQTLIIQSTMFIVSLSFRFLTEDHHAINETHRKSIVIVESTFFIAVVSVSFRFLKDDDHLIDVNDSKPSLIIESTMLIINFSLSFRFLDDNDDELTLIVKLTLFIVISRSDLDFTTKITIPSMTTTVSHPWLSNQRRSSSSSSLFRLDSSPTITNPSTKTIVNQLQSSNRRCSWSSILSELHFTTTITTPSTTTMVSHSWSSNRRCSSSSSLSDLDFSTAMMIAWTIRMVSRFWSSNRRCWWLCLSRLGVADHIHRAFNSKTFSTILDYSFTTKTLMLGSDNDWLSVKDIIWLLIDIVGRRRQCPTSQRIMQNRREHLWLEGAMDIRPEQNFWIIR